MKPTGDKQNLEELLALCQKCGACCAYFRIMLNWTEVESFQPDGVPLEMTVKISDYVYLMKGTESVPPRCVALDGKIGERVACRIYEKRCAECREFNPLDENGDINQACLQARKAHGISEF